MDDARHPLRFGYFLVPNADDPLLETAWRVEQLGLDCIGIQDHPYQSGYVETWSLLATIAATTDSITVFPDVANLPLRQPSVMAKAAATIDRLSGGRFELGLGAGAFWDAIESYGGPRRSPGESLEALEEAIAVIRAVWSAERGLRVGGEHHRLDGAHGGPTPAHPMGIWIGAYGPRALRLTGRVADGWVPSFRGELDPIVEMAARLDDAIAEAGREPSDVRRILNVGGRITDGATEGPFAGPPEQWVDDIIRLAEGQRFDTFVFWGDPGEQLDRFAQEVAPAARERMAQTG